MKKIVIVGSPGAGKSTLAQALRRVLNIKVFHLDRHFWQPGWQEYPRERRIAIEKELIKGRDQWIIEGSYLGSSEERLRAADTIIFLDIPRLVCLWRVIIRYFRHLRQMRPDIPEGCTERLSLPYILKVLVFPHRSRRLLLSAFKDFRTHEADTSIKILKVPFWKRKLPSDLLKAVQAHEASAHRGKLALIFQSSRHLEAFLQELATQKQKASTYKRRKAAYQPSKQPKVFLQDLTVKMQKGHPYQARVSAPKALPQV